MMMRSTRLRFCLHVLAVGWGICFFASPQGYGVTTVEITQGNANPIPLALSPFKALSPEKSAFGQQVLDVISNDLNSTGLFNLIPESDHIETSQAMGPVPRFADWRLLQTQGLMTGQVIHQSPHQQGGVEFRLWDVYTQRQMEGQALSGPLKSYRKIGHKISNLIYKRLIGEPGHFDTKIVYVSESAPNTKENKRRLAIMDFDGDNNKFISDDRSLVLTPRFSPTEPKVVYLSYEKKVPQIFLLDLISGKHAPLGRFAGVAFAPRFSPDGKKIIFSQSINGLSSIFEMELATKQLRQITRSPSIDTSPSYEPDGKRIVFNSDRSGTPQLYVMQTDGSQLKRISFGEGRYTTPVWSPRGDMIAFSKQHKNFYIGVMKPDGSSERLIGQGYVAEAPTWSPNGRMVMYTRTTQGRRGGPMGQTSLQCVDTTGRIEITLPTPTGASAADWSGFTTFESQAS